MLVENQLVDVKCTQSNKDYYISKGYSNISGTFEVKVLDLKPFSNVKVEVICDYCGKKFIKKFRDYNLGHKNTNKDSCDKCKVCKRHELTFKSRQEKHYKEMLIQSEKNNYELITQKTEIKNLKTRIKYICPKHGIHEMKLANYLIGRKCPDCATEQRRKKYQINKEDLIENISKFGGTLLNPNEYINSQTKNLRVLCPECGNEFLTSYRSFTQHGGQVCRECAKSAESIGEKKIRHFLEEHSIEFEQEKWFPDCRDVNPLPFDFYIPSKNLIIEFDGRQHFAETDHFTYSYSKVLSHDAIKNKYCEEKGIELIRIPYWKIEKINDILSDKLFT